MAFTEFYCDPVGGSNLNGGSSAGAAAYTSTNGNWNATTGVFTPASGNPSTSGVTVGAFASVYLDAATTAVFIGRVTAVDATTITVSLTAVSGTPPTTGATGRSIKVGGAWKGPNAADGFPLTLAAGAMTNAAGDPVRVNLLNAANYAITAAITSSVNGPVTFQGYATTPGDGGQVVIDGGTSGASYVLLTDTGVRKLWENVTWQNNGATGSATGVVIGSQCQVRRCKVLSVRGHGLSINSGTVAVECEVKDHNQSNTSSLGGFTNAGSGTTFQRCIAHDAAGSNASGWVLGNSATLNDCIADAVGGQGVFINAASNGYALGGCNLYGCGAAGLRLSANSTVAYAENCNFVGNATYGVNDPTTGSVVYLDSCGFYGNATADTNGVNASRNLRSKTYAADPFRDAANGDFTPTLQAARGTGRGSFTQTGYSSFTTSYPDVGPVQENATVVLTRSTGALVGTSETVGVSLAAGDTVTGNEVDVLGDNVSKGDVHVYAVFTPSVAGYVALALKLNSRRVTGQAYQGGKETSVEITASSASAQKVYVGRFPASRYMTATVRSLAPTTGASITNLAILYELEKTS